MNSKTERLMDIELATGALAHLSGAALSQAVVHLLCESAEQAYVTALAKNAAGPFDPPG